MRTWCLAIVWVAVAMALARFREVWLALDAINTGFPVAVCLYAWFWVGLALVVRRAETTPGRFFGLAGLFLSMAILPIVLAQRQVGVEPDYPGYFKAFMLLGSLAFAAAGALAWLLEIVVARRTWARRASSADAPMSGPRTLAS
jgi:hypothetical protein